MALTIRDMEARDFEGKARVHLLSWQETYAGLVDQSFLDALSCEKCLDITRRFPQNTPVAELDGAQKEIILGTPVMESRMIRRL